MVMDHQQPQVIHIASMAPQRSTQVSPFPKNLSRSTDEANAVGQRPANVGTKNTASPTKANRLGNLATATGYLFSSHAIYLS